MRPSDIKQEVSSITFRAGEYEAVLTKNRETWHLALRGGNSTTHTILRGGVASHGNVPVPLYLPGSLTETQARERAEELLMTYERIDSTVRDQARFWNNTVQRMRREGEA